MAITYLNGDATKPTLSKGETGLLVHVCNDVGGFGKGFVLALSNRWPYPEREYRRWHREGQDLLAGKFQLGAIQVVPVQGDPPLSVVNMIAQEGYGKGNRNRHRSSEPDSRPPIRYDALEQCLTEVGYLGKSGPAQGASIHMPRIGCGLAGGKWGDVEPIIERTLSHAQVTVYDPPGGKFNP